MGHCPPKTMNSPSPSNSPRSLAPQSKVGTWQNNKKRFYPKASDLRRAKTPLPVMNHSSGTWASNQGMPPMCQWALFVQQIGIAACREQSCVRPLISTSTPTLWHVHQNCAFDSMETATREELSPYVETDASISCSQSMFCLQDSKGRGSRVSFL